MRVARTVCGIVLIIFAVVAFLGGGALWTVMGHEGSDGAFGGAVSGLSTPGNAIVVPDIDALLRTKAPLVSGASTTVRLDASTPNGPAFVGLAPLTAVQAYLGPVGYARLTSLRVGVGGVPVTLQNVPASLMSPGKVSVVPGGVPVAQGIWTVAGSSGHLQWAPNDHRDDGLALVIMRADAAGPVQVSAHVEVRPGWLNGTTWALFSLGTALAIVAIALLLWPPRRRDVVYVVDPTQLPEIAERLGMTLAPLAASHPTAPHPAASYPTASYPTASPAMAPAAMTSQAASHVVAEQATAQDAMPSHVTASDATASHVTASHVTASHVTASHVTASHVTASHVTASPVTASHVTASPVTAPHVTASDATASHVTGSRMTASDATAPQLVPSCVAQDVGVSQMPASRLTTELDVDGSSTAASVAPTATVAAESNVPLDAAISVTAPTCEPGVSAAHGSEPVDEGSSHDAARNGAASHSGGCRDGLAGGAASHSGGCRDGLADGATLHSGASRDDLAHSAGLGDRSCHDAARNDASSGSAPDDGSAGGMVVEPCVVGSPASDNEAPQRAPAGYGRNGGASSQPTIPAVFTDPKTRPNSLRTAMLLNPPIRTNEHGTYRTFGTPPPVTPSFAWLQTAEAQAEQSADTPSPATTHDREELRGL